MSTFKAVFTPKPEIEADETDVSLNRMEMTFTIGPKSKATPEKVIAHTLRDLHLITFVNSEYWQISAAQVAENQHHPGSQPVGHPVSRCRREFCGWDPPASLGVSYHAGLDLPSRGIPQWDPTPLPNLGGMPTSREADDDPASR